RITGAKPYFANKQKKLRKTVSAFESRLDQLEVVQKPKELPSIQMDMLNEHLIHNQVIIRAQQVVGKIENRLLWQAGDFYIRNGEKVAIIGANWVGKTTLLKQIIHQMNGITVSPSIEIGYFAQNLTIVDY